MQLTLYVGAMSNLARCTYFGIGIPFPVAATEEFRAPSSNGCVVKLFALVVGVACCIRYLVCFLKIGATGARQVVW